MRLIVLILCGLWLMPVVFGQKNRNPTVPVAVTQNPVEAKVAGLKKFEGFFNFYYDEKQDKILLLIDKFNSEFLHVVSLTAGVGSNDIGLDRNKLGGERVVYFERRGSKVLLIEPNLAYRAISTNAAERRAVEEAFAQSVLWGFTIQADENGNVIVDATDFFIQDAFDVIGTLRSAQQGSYSLDKSRSAFYLPRTKGFPQNSEFEVTLTFAGQPTGQYIRSVTPTASSVTVRQHHSFVQLPDSNYRPRVFDARAGYFNTSYYDYATPISEPIEKRFITRHRLQKKDPQAAMSEAVEPIVYYMDRGAPEPIRSALMEGASWWNQAFEAAGYKNAFRVELLPEDADPMDVRYNVINWVHRSTRGWSYGNAVTDPRTGEIIKGHVTLGSLRVRQDFLIAEGLLAPYEEGKPASKEMEEMALNRLKQLAAHEVGHTLGLSHAYSSSSEHLASVMDYPHPIAKLKDGKIDLSQAYDNKIGEFDKFAIAFGYQDFPSSVDERNALNELIQNSLKKGLTFLSDQDARPLGGAHPYAHLWDNGKDPADELERVLEVRATAVRNFGERNIKMGAPMATLEEVFVPIYFFHRYQAEAAVKLIGGLNYRYAMRGDGQPVTELLTPQQELKAIDALMKCVSVSALSIPENLLKIIPPRPIGYNRSREVIKLRTELTFDPLSAAETASDMIFGMILHPARANRLVEHHARDPRLPALESVIDRMLASTIKSPVKTGVEGAIQMTTNYALFTNLVRLTVSKDASSISRSIALLKLEQMKNWIDEKVKSTLDEEWKAHYQFLVHQIDSYQDDPDEFKLADLLPPPPGQPIGDGDLDYCNH